MEKLGGPFKDIIPMFQKYKKSIGYKYDNINNYISVDKILKKQNIKNLNNSERIFNILIKEENDINKQKRNYLVLKELYSFMKILGYDNLYFEERFYHSYNNPTKPLSKKQIEIFFKLLDQHCKKANDIVLPIIFRLIYSSGLRISEAINLKITDFNKENGTLLITKSKNNITRIISLSNTMIDALNKYFNINDLSKNNYLFERKNKKIDKRYLEDEFNLITSIIGINSRVHALRFSFAIHTLDNLYKNKINSKEVLYPLSIYMGHHNIESTEYYLQFTIEYQKKYITNILPKGDRKNDI